LSRSIYLWFLLETEIPRNSNLQLPFPTFLSSQCFISRQLSASRQVTIILYLMPTSTKNKCDLVHARTQTHLRPHNAMCDSIQTVQCTSLYKVAIHDRLPLLPQAWVRVLLPWPHTGLSECSSSPFQCKKFSVLCRYKFKVHVLRGGMSHVSIAR